MLNLAALEQASVHAKPFPHFAMPNFINERALDRIAKDFPAITKPGSFPLEALQFGPAFASLIAELRRPEFRDIVGAKLGIGLRDRPATITVRGRARRRDGKIHRDSRSKLVTVLIYMNADGGRLRLLNSRASLDDAAIEAPPERGALLAYLNTENAWHGHKPFEGERRVIQLNWVRDGWAVWREMALHRLSALFKGPGS